MKIAVMVIGPWIGGLWLWAVSAEVVSAFRQAGRCLLDSMLRPPPM